jgi:hypothetical protein
MAIDILYFFGTLGGGFLVLTSFVVWYLPNQRQQETMFLYPKI